MEPNLKVKAVFNSSPIINLSKIDCLHLLFQLFDKIIIPNAVYDEIVEAGKDKKGTKKIIKVIKEGFITIRNVSNLSLVMALNRELDLGEAEAIVLALEINADLIVVDEKEARKYAELYEIKKTGVIGLLIRAKNRGYLDYLKPYLDLMVAEGFWLNKRLYQKILKEVDEWT